MARVLEFRRATECDPHQVGRVHPDGSISFRGREYRTLTEVPAECNALRPDVDTHRQWRSIYRAIDPRRKRRGPKLRLPQD